MRSNESKLIKTYCLVYHVMLANTCNPHTCISFLSDDISSQPAQKSNGVVEVVVLMGVKKWFTVTLYVKFPICVHVHVCEARCRFGSLRSNIYIVLIL